MSTDGGTALVPVDASQRDVRCLSPEELNAVAVLTKRVAEHMGSPQDVEWTLMDGHPILLQSRPITRLPMEPEPEVPARVFDNSNIQESYCGLTYPLTFSFASRAYHRVYAQTMAAVGLSAATIAADEKRLRGLLALVDGRVYYDIDNWYRGLLLLPSFGRNKADMEAMMGLTEPVDLVQDHVLSVGQKLAALPRLLLTGARLVAAIRGLPKSVPAWLARFDGRERSFREAPLAGLAFHRAMATLAQLDDQMLGDWHIPIVNDFAVMMHVGKLRRALERAVGDSADALLPRLLAGEQGIESTAPTHALMAMARTIDSRPALRDTVLHGTTEAAYAALTADPSLGPAVADYVARYGDRVVGELKLETKTLRHDPSFLIQVLRSYSGQPHLDPELLGAKERQTRSDAERELRDAVGAWRFRALHRQLRAARRAIKDRESMRLRRTRAFGLVRDVYRGIGKTLAQSGLLDDAEQVFFLTVEELRDFHDGRAVTADLAGLARMREAQYRSYEAGGEPPHRVIADGSPYLSRRAPAVANHDASSELSGIGCYPGVVEAAAQVVHEPTECASLDGKILVTTRTDPGWAPLFPSCGGIAVERGSTLSHSAVVARELGIPAVVGVPGLVAQIEQGEALRLDGARGTIIRLSQDSSAPQ